MKTKGKKRLIFSFAEKKLFIKFIVGCLFWLKRLPGKTKGFLKDPSFCLPGSFFQKLGKKPKKAFFSFYLKKTAVFLFVFLILGLIVKFSAGAEKNELCLASLSRIFTEEEKNDLFVGFSSGFSPESPDLILVGNSSLKPSSPPVTFSSQDLGSLVAGYELEEEERMAIIEHIVEGGETLSSLAARYRISLETVLWANDLNKSSTIKIGQKLVVLPVSGTVHHVKSGDTISEIARTYKGKTGEIVAFNRLSGEADIFVGDIVVVPNGVMPPPPVRQQQAQTSAPLASSYFIVPVSSPYIITQGLHWYNAIDFSHQGNACGRPVFATAGGTVQRTGYHGVAGNYVRVLHPNGVITFYGHLSSILVSPGQSVSQGTRIGLIGNTGYTVGQTGCHLHFEVRGAKNPFAR